MASLLNHRDHFCNFVKVLSTSYFILIILNLASLRISTACLLVILSQVSWLFSLKSTGFSFVIYWGFSSRLFLYKYNILFFLIFRPSFVFLSLLALDIASHWMQMYRYLHNYIITLFQSFLCHKKDIFKFIDHFY